MMGSISIWHWLIVLAIVIMVFGTKKLGAMGKDIGAAVHGFKEGIKGEEEPKQLPEKEINPTMDNANHHRRR